MNDEIKIPQGVTCHYVRVDKKWYVFWGADFLQDKPGSKLVPENEAWLLECGYQIGKQES